MRTDELHLGTRATRGMTTRITGGEHRGRRIRSTGGADLRPASEKVRLAVFSILGAEAVEGARVLDLYAGTGSLGLESLSRGASWIDFVETHRGRCREMREFLRELGMESRGRVHCTAVERALRDMAGEYGIIFAAPPYRQDPWDTVMNQLDSGNLVKQGGLVVAEHRHGFHLEDRYGRLGLSTRRRYGGTSISIYEASTDNG